MPGQSIVDQTLRLAHGLERQIRNAPRHVLPGDRDRMPLVALVDRLQGPVERLPLRVRDMVPGNNGEMT